MRTRFCFVVLNTVISLKSASVSSRRIFKKKKILQLIMSLVIFIVFQSTITVNHVKVLHESVTATCIVSWCYVSYSIML